MNDLRNYINISKGYIQSVIMFSGDWIFSFQGFYTMMDSVMRL